MNHLEEIYDVIVVGGGHAGCEAALAAARLGLETVLFTVSIESIALMPCNPNIGGTSKGHLVREVDALGGEMGVNTDKTFIQSKMLNASKGPAVHSLRAQADKMDYTLNMRKTLENTDGLTIRQMEISSLIIEREGDGSEEKRVCRGVVSVSGARYLAASTVIATGTYLRSRCIYGEVSEDTGPNGLKNAKYLSDSLLEAGIRLYRFKTGTPARIDGRTIDYSKMEEQKGDDPVIPFSFTTDRDNIKKNQVSCWLTYTEQKTHRIIQKNIHRSPLYSGDIEGIGPRYCPSIEDKVMKFPDKDRHQIFVEPEGMYTNEMYLAGMSSSLPEDVQYAMIRTVPGLENAKIVRNAYAIEYDCIDARQLSSSLEFKDIKGLFSAGQFNGSSGYEEAAAQGLIAGINASMKVLNRPYLIIDRSEAYIGVLIDDLVTKECHEPYRMMTSRSEYRLLLRQDNADMRLTEKGYEVGLISKERYESFLKKKEAVEREVLRLENTFVGAGEATRKFLSSHGSTPLKTSATLAEIIRRPEMSYDLVYPLDANRPLFPGIQAEVAEQVNIQIKYEGYIKRQIQQVHQFKKLEKKKIPGNLDYNRVRSLRKEALQKLDMIRPESIGQASRIAGVSPADITVLLLYLEGLKRKKP